MCYSFQLWTADYWWSNWGRQSTKFYTFPHKMSLITAVYLRELWLITRRQGPVDNRPSTNKLHLFVPPPKKRQVTQDMWHMTCDMLWGVNILSKFQLRSSYCLWYMISWRLGGKSWLIDWLNYLINNKGVYITAPATPGVLSISGCEIPAYYARLINRSGIAGAVLQTPLSLIRWVTDAFPPDL